MEVKETDSLTWRKAQVVAAICFLYSMRGNSFEPDAMPRGVLAKLLGVERHRVGRAIADARESLRLAVAIKNRLDAYDEKPKKPTGRPAGSKNRTEQERELARKKRLPIGEHIRKMHKGNELRIARERAIGEEEERRRSLRLRVGSMTDADLHPRSKHPNPNMSMANYPTTNTNT